MSRKYEGPPIDATEQYISERETDGETVAGTSDDDNGEMTTDNWPSAVPRKPFVKGTTEGQSLQSQIVEHLSIRDGSDASVAEKIDCSTSQVQAVRNKVSVFATPDEVSFEIPDSPRSHRLADYAMAHEESRFDADSLEQLHADDSTEDGEDSSTSDEESKLLEICERYYEQDQDTATIAQELGIAKDSIPGRLAHCPRNNQDDSSEEDTSDETPQEDISTFETADDDSESSQDAHRGPSGKHDAQAETQVAKNSTARVVGVSVAVVLLWELFSAIVRRILR